MFKVSSSIFLAAMMAALLSNVGLSVAPAQDKKDVKKDTTTGKSAKKETKKEGLIEIKEGKDGKFRFFIRTAEGALIASGGVSGFEKKEEAEKAIDTLKEILPTAKIVVEKAAK